MKLDRVTVTGADDSVEARALMALTEKYPFVEWGILFSGSRQGTPRYPSYQWVCELSASRKGRESLSAHLCGQWVRDLVLEGNGSWWGKYDPLWGMFQRVQLNFHGQYHRAGKGFPEKLKELSDHEFILQHDGVNDETILKLRADLPVFPLFDRSGGTGIVPEDWPKPIWKYQGYAGGLGPENLTYEIRRIGDVVGDGRIWIDMETRVRSDDGKFDLAKVESCLRQAAPFVQA